MNQIMFDDENDLHLKSKRLLNQSDAPPMARFLMKMGIVKDERSAFILLIVIIAVVVLITFYYGKNIVGDQSVNETVMDRFGNTYTEQEYIILLRQGKDPTSPYFQP